MLKWQGIKSWIQKVKLYSSTAYRVAGVGLVGQHEYPLLYDFQGIGSSRRSMPSLGPSLELCHQHCRI
jgi:hypothetical protein